MFRIDNKFFKSTFIDLKTGKGSMSVFRIKRSGKLKPLENRI